jgi:hypothetical protein
MPVPGGVVGTRFAAAAQHDFCPCGQEERRRVGVRVAEAQVAAQRSGRADADVRNRLLHLRERRNVLLDERRALDLPMRHRGTDLEVAVVEAADTGKVRDPAQVDEVVERAEAELEQQQQFGAARDRDGIVSVAAKQAARLVHR